MSKYHLDASDVATSNASEDARATRADRVVAATAATAAVDARSTKPKFGHGNSVPKFGTEAR